MTQTAIGGFNVETQQYTIESQAKYRLYSLPFSYSDSIITLGAKNRTHNLTIMLRQDSDMETLLDILNRPSTTLLDVEGLTHFVYPLDFSIEQVGGEPQIYTATVSFVEDMANAPTMPLPTVNVALTFQVLNAQLQPIVNAQVTIGTTTLLTNSGGYAGPFTIALTPLGVTLTLLVEYSTGTPIPNAQVIIQSVRKVTDSTGHVVFYITSNGIFS